METGERIGEGLVVSTAESSRSETPGRMGITVGGIRVLGPDERVWGSGRKSGDREHYG